MILTCKTIKNNRYHSAAWRMVSASTNLIIPPRTEAMISSEIHDNNICLRVSRCVHSVLPEQLGSESDAAKNGRNRNKQYCKCT